MERTCQLPEDALNRWSNGTLPNSQRRTLLSQAAVLLADRCRKGESVLPLQPEQWWVEQGQLCLPHSGVSTSCSAPPDRTQVEALLEAGTELFHQLPCSLRDQQRAYLVFTRTLTRDLPGLKLWKQIVPLQQSEQTQHRVRMRYQAILRDGAEHTEEGYEGTCPGLPGHSLHSLWEEIEGSRARPDALLKQGARATLWRGHLQGQPVVIKRYEPNPRVWRRPLETCRGLRAWAGAQLLRELGICVPEPLGWIRIRIGPDREASVFLSSPLPDTETVRAWIRREWPRMASEDRVQFRHQFRQHLLRLYQAGLVHLDCKLSNIRIAERKNAPRFIWTDLEDIRPRRMPFRTFLRNLYQLNGSLPRFVSREERNQFLKGFSDPFPFSTRPWVRRYAERVTRQRHRRELQRQCGA